MQQKTIIAGVFVGVAIVVLALGSLFTVDERETAFVLQFGELQKVYATPGLKAKIPFMQEVVKYDKRLLNASLPAMEVTAGDQKRIAT
jgi:membrane protease subunit HflC